MPYGGVLHTARFTITRTRASHGHSAGVSVRTRTGDSSKWLLRPQEQTVTLWQARDSNLKALMANSWHISVRMQHRSWFELCHRRLLLFAMAR